MIGLERVFVAGGAGFMGSAFCRALARDGVRTLVYDKLTYAGSLARLDAATASDQSDFVRADICDAKALREAIRAFAPDAIVNFAAETHVDRSIEDPAPFIETNVKGAWTVADTALGYWRALPAARRIRFRLVHVSTDEVFGALDADSPAFSEISAYAPRSPYAASKAAADHMVRSMALTFGLPLVVLHPSNTYGPYQYPEKLIPLTVLNAILGEPMRVYGQGQQVRDWIHVDDVAAAILAVLERGRAGQSYLISGRAERKNISVVQTIASILDEFRPKHAPYSQQIRFVEDRPGHDFRYASDPSGLENETGWRELVSFDGGLRQTIQWYLENESWWSALRAEGFDGRRIGADRTWNVS